MDQQYKCPITINNRNVFLIRKHQQRFHGFQLQITFLQTHFPVGELLYDTAISLIVKVCLFKIYQLKCNIFLLDAQPFRHQV